MRVLYDFVHIPLETKKNTIGIGTSQSLSGWNIPTVITDAEQTVEYTPVAFLPGDLDMFFTNFSSNQVGQRPLFNSIDGGK